MQLRIVRGLWVEKGLWTKTRKCDLCDLGRRECLWRQMTMHWSRYGFKCPVQRVLRDNLEFIELQCREHNLLHRVLVLKFGDHLSITALTQPQLVRRLAISERRSPFLIDGAAREYRP